MGVPEVHAGCLAGWDEQGEFQELVGKRRIVAQVLVKGWDQLLRFGDVPEYRAGSDQGHRAWAGKKLVKSVGLAAGNCLSGRCGNPTHVSLLNHSSFGKHEAPARGPKLRVRFWVVKLAEMAPEGCGRGMCDVPRQQDAR